MQHHSLLPLLFVPALCAQGIVSPGAFAGAEGPSYGTMPIGAHSLPVRHLQVHGDVGGAPRTIGAIAFRRAMELNGSNYSAYSILCDVWLSTAATGVDAPNATFDANHGPDRQLVAGAHLVHFPADAGEGPWPAPFAYRIPFQQPFAWSGQGDLCWDVRVQSRTSGPSPNLDAADDVRRTDPWPVVAHKGSGCVASGYTTPVYVFGSAHSDWAQSRISVTLAGSSWPRNALVHVGFGTSEAQWGQVPLPLPLPGTGCTVYAEQLLHAPVLTSASGQFNATFGVVTNPAHHGVGLFAQALAVDPTANSFGVVLSRMVQVSIIAPYASVPVAEVSSASGGATGTAKARNGVITRFE